MHQPSLLDLISNSPKLDQDKSLVLSLVRESLPLNWTNSGITLPWKGGFSLSCSLTTKAAPLWCSKTSITWFLLLIWSLCTDLTCRRWKPKGKWQLRSQMRLRRRRNSSMLRPPLRGPERSCLARSLGLSSKIEWLLIIRNKRDWKS